MSSFTSSYIFFKDISCFMYHFDYFPVCNYLAEEERAGCFLQYVIVVFPGYTSFLFEMLKVNI